MALKFKIYVVTTATVPLVKIASVSPDFRFSKAEHVLSDNNVYF